MNLNMKSTLLPYKKLSVLEQASEIMVHKHKHGAVIINACLSGLSIPFLALLAPFFSSSFFRSCWFFSFSFSP